MFKNYLKIVLRNLKKNKIYTVINLAGLAVGMTAFILIFFHIRYELSYDGFHEKGERVYRIIRQYSRNVIKNTPEELYIGGTPAPLAPYLVQTYPEVLAGTRVGEVNGILRLEDSKFSQNGIFADSNFFDIFSFKLLQGDAERALQTPFSIILTRELAKKCFGREDPLGKMIHFYKQKNESRSGQKNEDYDVQVTGILEDVPSNSHLRFDYILSFATITATPGNAQLLETWQRSDYYNYIELDPQTGPDVFNEKIAALADQRRGQKIETYVLQSLRDIHFKLGILDEMPGNMVGDIKQVTFFSLIAFVILLVACINYMNLATARFTRRLKEIGVRKVIGAHKSQLVRQFLTESTLLSVFAVFLALGMVGLLLPVFSRFVGREISLSLFNDPLILSVLFGVVVFTGLISGSYPALFLSSIRPISIFRGGSNLRLSGGRMRNMMVCLQFAVTILLITCTVVISSQIRHVLHKDVGYDREHVVVMPLRDEEARNQGSIILKELRRLPNVQYATSSEYIPLAVNNIPGFWYEDESGDRQNINALESGINYDFFKVFKLKLLAGRTFSPEYQDDEKGTVILNETAARKTGWKEPVGKMVHCMGYRRIIGVVKDFHHASLHEGIQPMVLHLRPQGFAYVCVRINPDNIPRTISLLKKNVEKFSPHFAFEYYFQDDYFNMKYSADQRFRILFGSFSLLAVFIACIGLFGLSSFVMEQRTKEIGIRKVLGASLPGLIRLLSWKYIILVVAANAVAWPLAYIIMSRWLQNFAFRIDLEAWMFLLASLITLLIVMLTVSIQSFRAARTDPVRSLRFE
ncbi:MAG: ABC transporter permease [Candidatus Aminicenantes bacterium]|nr:ABC transporter permease [Candidatus Aminicenantes bacterium]